MSRKFKLTWQPGTAKRAGRWKKVYRGKAYYFYGGSGKYDTAAYEEAVRQWESRKVELDASVPKRHQADYEREIARLEAVLAWSRQHDDTSLTEIVASKLSGLRQRLAAPRPRPLRQEDTFDGLFEPSVRDPELAAALLQVGDAAVAAYEHYQPDLSTAFGRTFEEARQRIAALPLMPSSGDESEAIDPATLPQLDAPCELSIEKALWEDRLAVANRQSGEGYSAAYFCEQFIAEKRTAADSDGVGGISKGRYDTIRRYAREFVQWYGESMPVEKINGQTMARFQSELLKRAQDHGWSGATTKDRLDTVKSFVRWLYQIEALSKLPRNMDSRSGSLRLPATRSEVVVFEISEIQTLLSEAVEKTELFLLLMLNCGMTQKDIGSLVHSEFDLKSGRITRKRSKTRHHKGVPEVSYLLWPRTKTLLSQHSAAPDSDYLIVNRNGKPLWSEELRADGVRTKLDNIKSAFRRLQSKVGIEKTLRSLKKTSATLLRANANFAGIESLFLGHAPTSMSQKHYTLPPQALLDLGIQWLADKYGLPANGDPVTVSNTN